jgi:hypothetical protein
MSARIADAPAGKAIRYRCWRRFRRGLRAAGSIARDRDEAVRRWRQACR